MSLSFRTREREEEEEGRFSGREGGGGGGRGRNVFIVRLPCGAEREKYFSGKISRVERGRGAKGVTEQLFKRALDTPTLR